MPDGLFVDTDYVIALINQNDQHHSQALQLAERYDGHPLVTTDAILIEIGNALSRFARNEAATIICYFQTAPEVTLVPLTPDLMAAALDLYAQHQDKTWGLVDCVSFLPITTWLPQRVQQALTTGTSTMLHDLRRQLATEFP